MTAQTHYLTSIISYFSTFLRTKGCSFDEQQEAVVDLMKLLEYKKDFSNWSSLELEKFYTERTIAFQNQALLREFISSFPPHQVNVYLHEFTLALAKDGCSPATIKNYRSDIDQFIYFSNDTAVAALLSKPKVLAFLKYEQNKGLRYASIHRKLVSITQFAFWAENLGLIHNTAQSLQKLKLTLNTELSSSTHSHNKEYNPNDLISSSIHLLHGKADSNSNQAHVATTKTLDARPKTLNIKPPSQGARANQEHRVVLQEHLDRLNQKITNATPKFLIPYLNSALLIILLLGVGYFGYVQLFRDAPQPLAYPATPNRPTRSLSFQGRLTDTAENPVTTATDMRFRLFDAPSGGTELWDSTVCSVTPDQDGIFSTGLGDECGAEISENVFSENASVYLQVTIEGETLDPRQPIKAVAYALNSETLQGYPIDDSGATASTVVTMDQFGDVVLAEASPVLRSTTGTFTIEAQSLLLQTTAGSNGDITLSPDGTGEINLNSNVIVDGSITPLTTDQDLGSSSLRWDIYANTLNADSTVTLTGLGTGTDNTVLILDASNNVTTDEIDPRVWGATLVDGSGTANYLSRWTDTDTLGIGVTYDNGTNVGINTTSPTAKLDVRSGATNSDVFKLIASDGSRLGRFTETSGGHGWFEIDNSSGTAQFLFRADAGDSYLNSGNVGVGTTSPTQRLDISGNLRLSGAFYDSTNDPGTSGYVLTSTVTGTDWADPAILAGGTNLWDTALGALYPKNSTMDLLIGGTATASAKFAFLNVNSGTPTASISAGAAGASTLTATGVLGTTAMQNLTLGDATTGNLTFAPAGSTAMTILQNGNVGVGTTAPAQKFDLVGGRARILNNSGSSYLVIENNGDASQLGTSHIADNFFTGTAQGDFSLRASNGQKLFLGADNGSGTANPTATITGANVGIGTISPGYKLDVTGDFRVTSSASFDGNIFLGNATSDTVSFTARVASGITPSLTNSYSLGASSLRWNQLFTSNNGIRIGADLNDATIAYDGTNLNFDPDSNSTIDVIFSDGGNVGIGTTLASQKLHVEGDMQLTGAFYDSTVDAGTPGYILSTTGSGTDWIDPSTVGTNYWQRVAGNLSPLTASDTISATSSAATVATFTSTGTNNAFQAGNATDYLYIDSGGNLIPSNDVTMNLGESELRFNELFIGGGTIDMGTDGDSGLFGYNTASDYFSFDPDNDATAEFVMTDTGNFGVGSTNPGQAVDVVGNVRSSSQFLASDGSAAAPGFAFSSGPGRGMFFESSRLNFVNSSTTGFFLDSGLNFVWNENGSGTRTFTLKPSNGQTADAFIFQQNPNQGNATLFGIGGKGNVSILPDTASVVPLTITAASAQSADFLAINANGGSGGDIFGISSAGNVGIGSASPGMKLDVNGDIRAASGSDFYLGAVGFNDNGTSSSGASLIGLYDDAMAYISANTNVQDAIKQLDTAIGTVSGNNYWQRITGNLSPLNLNDTLSATTSAATALTLTQTGAFNALLVQDETSDASPFVIDQNGNVGISTTTAGSKLDIGAISANNAISIRTNNNIDATGLTTASSYSMYNAFAPVGVIGTDLATAYGIYNTGTANKSEYIYGVYNDFTTTGGGVGTADVYGLYSRISTSHATHSGYGSYFETNSGSSAGTQYAYYANMTAGTATKYGLYINGGSNYLSGNLGVGDTTPDQLLEVLSSAAANTQLSIGNTNAGDFDPRIGFELADGTNTFTIGVDDSDSDKFKISTTGLGTNDRFVVDSGGNIGIGTDSPNGMLDVAGQVRIRNANNALVFTGNSAAISFSSSTGTKAITTAGTTDLELSPGGNVGINTSTASQKLDVNGNIRLRSGLYDVNNQVGSSGQILSSTGTGTDWIDADSVGTNYWQRIAGNLSPLTVNDTLSATTSAATALTLTQTGAFNALLVQDETSDTTPFIIDQAGNVGVGTTATAGKLDVSGIFRSTYVGSSTAIEVFGTDRLIGSSGGGHVGLAGSSISVGQNLNVPSNGSIFTTTGGDTSSGSYAFYARNSSLTDLMVIQNNGNVGVGTTAAANKLHLYGTDGEFGISMTNTDSSGDRSIFNALTTDAGSAYWGLTGNAGRLLSPTGAGDLAFSNRTGGAIMFSADTAFTEAQLTILETGNIGINTATPTQKLDVNGTIRLRSNLYDENNSVGTPGQILSTTATGIDWIDSPTGTVDGTGTTNYLARWTDSNTLGIGTTFDNGTNVGIGSNSPSAKLDVTGGANVSGNVGIGLITAPASPIQMLTADKAIRTYTSSSSNEGLLIDSYEINSAPYLRIADIVALGDTGGSNGGSAIRFITNNSDNASAVERMRIDKVGNVGIGTDNALAKLNISGAETNTQVGAGAVSSIRLQNTDQSGANRLSEIQFATAGSSNFAAISGSFVDGASNTSGKLQFSTRTLTGDTNLTERLTILGSGNVGVSSTNPAAKLDVAGNGVFSGNVSVGTTDQYTKLLLQGSDSNTQVGAATSTAIRLQNTEQSGAGRIAEIQFSTAGNTKYAAISGAFTDGSTNTTGNLYFSTRNSTADANLTERMTILNTGNIGIATTAPTQKLDVNGTLRLRSSVYDENNSVGTPGQILSTTATGVDWINAPSGGSVAWNDIISPSGNLALDMSTNTTTFNWDTGTSTNDLFNLTTDASSNGTGSLLNIQTGASSTVVPLRVRAGATEALYVTTAGNIGVGTTTASYKLDVNGTFRAASTSNAVFGNGTTGGLQLGDGTITKTSGNIFTFDSALSSGGVTLGNPLGGSPLGLGSVQLGAFAGAGNVGVDSAKDIVFYTSGAATGEILRLEASAGNVGIGDATPTYKLDVNGTGRFTGAVDLDGDLELNSTLTDVNGSVGTSGQILSSTATGVDWIDAPATTSLKWNALTVPDGNLSLAMDADTTSFSYNTLTSGTGWSLNSSATAFTGTLSDITLSGSDAANTGTLFAVNNTGTSNANTSMLINHYATGTNNLAFRINDVSGDTSPFVIDGTGNVGISTSAPTEALDIIGNIRANQLIDTTGSGAYFLDPAAGGTSLVVAGNIGIGSLSPAFKLDVNGTFRASGASQFDGNLTLGNATTDEVIFTGRVNSDILPISDGDFDLGSSALRWNALYVKGASIHLGDAGNESILGYSGTAITFDANGDSTPDYSISDSGNTTTTGWVRGNNVIIGGRDAESGCSNFTNIVCGATDLWLGTDGGSIYLEDAVNVNDQNITNIDNLQIDNNVGIGTTDVSTAKLYVRGGVTTGQQIEDATTYGMRITNLGASAIGARIDATNGVGITVSSAGVAGEFSSSGSHAIYGSGSWRGNAVIDTDGANNQTKTITTRGLMYDLRKSTGTTDTATTTTWNITGLSDVDGSFAFIQTVTSKGVTAAARQQSVVVQLNGSQISIVQTANGTAASTVREAYIVARSNSEWHLAAGQVASINADLSEWLAYTGTAPVAGQIMSLVDNTSGEISSNAYQPALAGVVSTAPHTTMGPEKPNSVPLALAGRVPVIVTTKNGQLKPGDYITSSNYSGTGMKARFSGQVVGKAMESTDSWTSCPAVSDINTISWPEDDGTNPTKPCFTLPNGDIIGKIMMLIDNSWYEGEIRLDEAGEILIAEENGTYTVTEVGSGTPLKRIAAYSQAIIGQIRAGLVSTKDLIVEETATIADLSVNSLQINGQSLADYIASIVGQQSQNMGQPSTINGQPIVDSLQMTDESLEITNTDNETIALIDESGNASFSGQLSSRLAVLEQVQTTELTATTATISGTTSLGSLLTETASVAGTITAQDATISGSITANSARLELLEGRVAELQSIKAQTAELMDATISGTLYANNIADFEQKVASAMNQPSLLATLLQQIPPNPAPPSQVVPPIEGAGYNATGAAELNKSLEDLELDTDDIVLLPSAVFIDQYLKVNGIAYVADQLGVGNSILVGNGMEIRDGTIAYSPSNNDAPVFKIQPSGQGTLELMAGLMTLTADGSVTVNGNLAVTGDLEVGETLLSDLLRPTDFGNPFQVQVAGASSESADIKQSRFEIVNENRVPVATISAQGRAQFADGIGIGSENLGSGATLQSSQSSGRAILSTNTLEVTINSSKITENSLIYITPVGSTNNKVMYVKAQTPENLNTPENEGSFVVGFDEILDRDVTFNWWIVN